MDFFGAVAIAIALYWGLFEVAQAIRYKKTEIFFKGPIKIVTVTREENEKSDTP